jgi:hypothetical protein
MDSFGSSHLQTGLVGRRKLERPPVRLEGGFDLERCLKSGTKIKKSSCFHGRWGSSLLCPKDCPMCECRGLIRAADCCICRRQVEKSCRLGRCNATLALHDNGKVFYGGRVVAHSLLNTRKVVVHHRKRNVIARHSDDFPEELTSGFCIFHLRYPVRYFANLFQRGWFLQQRIDCFLILFVCHFTKQELYFATRVLVQASEMKADTAVDFEKKKLLRTKP